jgi:hypothetical protein
MTNDSRHFSFVILDEGQLRTIDLDEEIHFRFGIHIENALEDVLVPDLPDQLISFSSDRQFHSSGRHGVRRKFVVADTGIKKFCVQLDGDMQFGWFRSFRRLVGLFLIFQNDSPVIRPLYQGVFDGPGNISSLNRHLIIPQKAHERAHPFLIGRQRFTRPPGFMDQFQEPVIGRFCRQIRSQESSRRSLPGTVLQVPPGNGLNRRMREKQCIQPFHVIGLPSFPFWCRWPRLRQFSAVFARHHGDLGEMYGLAEL